MSEISPEEALRKAKEIAAQLRRLFQYCRDKNIYLNPKKFWPCATEYDSFGIKRTMYTSEVAEGYKKRIIAFAKPQTVGQWKEMDGMTSYISNYVYNGSLIKYWIREITNNQPKSGKIKWTPEADLAWEQLLYLVNHLPILYNPTPDGEFLVKTDACNYGMVIVSMLRHDIPYYRLQHTTVWYGTAWRCQALCRHVPNVFRLCAQRGSDGGVDGLPEHHGLHP